MDILSSHRAVARDPSRENRPILCARPPTGIWRGTAIRAALLGAVLLSGCYGKQLMRQPITVDETAESVQSLREQQIEMAKNLRALEDQLAKQSDLLRQLKAEDQSRASDLAEELLGIDSKLQDLLTRRGGSSSSYAPPAYTPPPPMADTSRATFPGVNLSGGPGPSAPPTTGDTPEAEAKRIYDQAYLDYSKSNFTLAVGGFREYLRRMPSGDLSDNAQFWIGDAFYAQRDFDNAIREFTKVTESFPKGDKVPAALLKIGYSRIQLGDTSEARRLLNQVIDEYPNSDESTLAKSKLRQLQ